MSTTAKINIIGWSLAILFCLCGSFYYLGQIEVYGEVLECQKQLPIDSKVPQMILCIFELKHGVRKYTE